MIAGQTADWLIIEWTRDFELFDGLNMNIASIIQDMTK